MIDWETMGTGGLGDLFVVRIFEIGVKHFETFPEVKYFAVVVHPAFSKVKMTIFS